MSWFTTDYLDPEALHNVWFEIDQPIYILFHKEDSLLCKEFEKLVLRAIENSKKVAIRDYKYLLMKCDEASSLPKDYKTFRLPCLILYDGVEKGRINSMVSDSEITAWIENGN